MDSRLRFSIIWKYRQISTGCNVDENNNNEMIRKALKNLMILLSRYIKFTTILLFIAKTYRIKWGTAIVQPVTPYFSRDFTPKVYFYQKYDMCILKKELYAFYSFLSERRILTRLSTVNHQSQIAIFALTLNNSVKNILLQCTYRQIKEKCLCF